MRDTFFVTNQDNNERSNCEKNIFNLTNREINLMRYSFLEEILYYLYHPRYTFYYCKQKIWNLKDRLISYVSSHESNAK